MKSRYPVWHGANALELIQDTRVEMKQNVRDIALTGLILLRFLPFHRNWRAAVNMWRLNRFYTSTVVQTWMAPAMPSTQQLTASFLWRKP